MFEFNNLLLASSGWLIAFFVIDVILVLGAVGILIWVLIKMSKTKKQNSNTNGFDKIDESTYIMKNSASKNEEIDYKNLPVSQVERFSNQIEKLSEEQNEVIAASVKKEINESAPQPRVLQEGADFTATKNEVKANQTTATNTTMATSEEFLDKLKQITNEDAPKKSGKKSKK